MCTAIYPGSFDPPTLGHLDIIRRCSAIHDKVVVCVMRNGAKGGSLFSCAERAELLSTITADLPNVQVDTYGGLLADYARRYPDPVIVRGLRAVTDFEYEFQMANVNRKLAPEIETIFMIARDKYTFLSSSVVRELGRYRGDLGEFVPSAVEQALRVKLGAREFEAE